MKKQFDQETYEEETIWSGRDDKYAKVAPEQLNRECDLGGRSQSNKNVVCAENH